MSNPNSISTFISNALDDLPGDLRSQVVNEFKSGYRKEWVNAGIQQQKIAKQTSINNFKAVDGIGRLRMRVDPTLYHYWGHKLGYGCWKDSQFLMEIERDNPEVRVKSGGTRLQVGFDGAKRSSQKFDL
jgi:hypothetical protein